MLNDAIKNKLRFKNTENVIGLNLMTFTLIHLIYFGFTAVQTAVLFILMLHVICIIMQVHFKLDSQGHITDLFMDSNYNSFTKER